MPIIKVEIYKGHTQEYKKTLLQGIHEALVNGMGMSDDDRVQRLYELESENFERSQTKTENFTVVEIVLFPGRTMEMKAKTIEEMTRILSERLQISAMDVLVVMIESGPENWCLKGVYAPQLYCTN